LPVSATGPASEILLPRSILHRLPHPVRDHGRIIIERERQSPLEPVRPGDEQLHPSPERIGRDPRLVRAGGVPAACNDRRLDALAAMTGDALDLKDGERQFSF
jgi:hypothetical protein